MRKFYLIFILSGIFASTIYAQTIISLQTKIQLTKGRQPIATILEAISKQTGANFSYSDDLTSQQKVYFNGKTLTLKQTLDKILTPQKLEFLQKGKMIIIRKINENNQTNIDNTTNPSHNGRRTRSKLCTISGVVHDKSNGEALIGATIYIKSLNKGVVTNAYGFYSLKLPRGNHSLVVSYIGFQNIHHNLDLKTNKHLNIALPQGDNELKEVVVMGKGANEHIENIEMSTNKLGIEQIKNMPAFLGEADVVQSILALPGVSSVGEGSSGFNVRGGGVDQNLILLDEAIVYNSSHLLGLFSVFNPNSVKDVKLYKGAIPASYGGRLSSVLDIRQKEGNTKRFSGEGGIGLVSSRLTLEAPIIKDKSSLLIAGRRSYADLLLKLSDEQGLKESQVYFYDLNTKFNYTIDKNNKLYVSGYFGRDVVSLAKFIDFSWGNSTAAVRWNHLFNDQLFSNLSLIFSDYNYHLNATIESASFDWTAGITNYQVKNDLTWFISPEHTLDFGVSAILYKFNPGRVAYKRETEETFVIAQEKSVETAAYFSNEHKLTDRLTLNYGLRYSLYWNLGDRDVRIYRPDQPRRTESVIDTKHYNNNEVIANYWGLEPRFRLCWELNRQNALKMSYARNRQYIHLISNTTAPVPTDIWKSAGKHIKPMTSDQLALGYFHSLTKPGIELSAEAYYKKMVNMVDYKSGVELLLNEFIETELLSGKGRAYGLELMAKKTKGKLNGWLSYTLARSERQINGNFPEERINDGKYYPANYDKTHSVNLALTYKQSKRLSFSANFVYSTGRPLTFPNAKYQYMGQVVLDYSERNQNRIPDYHRLDLAVTCKGKGKPNRSWRGEWVFSLYNVYARRNAYSVYFIGDGVGQNQATKLSILATVFPSVTYNFTF